MARFQTVIQSARFVYSPYTATEMQGFGQVPADSIRARCRARTGGGRRFSGLDGANKRGCRLLDLILGGPCPARRRRFREPIAQHCGTKQRAPGLRRGLFLTQLCNLPIEQQQ